MLPQTIQWIGNSGGFVRLIDQTVLPGACDWLDCTTPEQVWQAIKRLSVRGAPAIGIAAAYGVVLSLRPENRMSNVDAVQSALKAADHLASSRPTAVNLFWALSRIRNIVETFASESGRGETHENALAQTLDFDQRLQNAIHAEAVAIHDEDRRRCQRIGAFGAPLLNGCQGVLTHCNAGALATSEYGTALGVIYSAHQHNPSLRVYADETRPLLQGARLTAWELAQSGVDVTVICDSMAAQVMREGKVQAVVVGADRIAANGDSANKIGTYSLAIVARYHRIPFYVAAPLSTFDTAIDTGAEIPIELRGEEEIAWLSDRRVVTQRAAVYNPAFDVTPHELISAIITDAGIITNFDPFAIRELCRSFQAL